MLRLHPDWKTIVTRAWSVRAILLAAAIELAEKSLDYVRDFIPWWLAVGILAAAIGLRLVKQKDVSGDDE